MTSGIAAVIECGCWLKLRSYDLATYCFSRISRLHRFLLILAFCVSTLNWSSAAGRVDWSGFYIGVHGGHGRGDPVTMNLAVTKVDGYVAGFQLGYLWVSPHNQSVFGFEADFSGSNVAGLRGTILDYKLNFVTTIRGRYGYADGRNLYFVTAGFAHGEFKVAYTGGDLTEHHVGYALGLGFERMISKRWTARGEYLFTRFGTTYYDGQIPIDWEIHVTRIGVNYRF
jgi:opacity protein-like surface antigen